MSVIIRNSIWFNNIFITIYVLHFTRFRGGVAACNIEFNSQDHWIIKSNINNRLKAWYAHSGKY